jgi:hypothetical protein
MLISKVGGEPEEFQKAIGWLLQLELPTESLDGVASGQQLAKEHLEQELIRIELEWQVEQRRYYWDYSGEGEKPAPQPPHVFGIVWSVVAGLGIVGYGIWLLSMGSLGPIVLGMVIILMGMWIPVFHQFKYSRYRRAYECYKRRRADLLAKLNFDELKQVLIQDLHDRLDIAGIAELLGKEFARTQGYRALKELLYGVQLPSAERQRLMDEILDEEEKEVGSIGG